ncbi:MAG: 16S rRNA (cytosine(967)-C(5))-methyltransferase RsmB [Acidobacteria bacterium]|nr:16S rRNA (cytosine(967)-C(5))-methyltransferase RsmB [Acidobacteriota bacterium]
MAKPKPVSPARRASFEILREEEAGAFSSILLAAYEPQLKPADRALCHEVVLGVLRWQLWLDKLIEHYAKRAVESLDLPVRLALRIGLYQLRFLTRVPASAAVNESVNLVRSARVSSAAAFVNAVLRRAIREADYDPSTTLADSLEKLAVQTSHPLWLVQRWANEFGFEETEAFARANNSVPPTALRVVNRDFKDVETQLIEAGGVIEPSKVVENAWRVSGASSLLRELAANGNIYLQDEASQLVAQTVDVQPGERVLDLCAAPGSKTTLMAQQPNESASRRGSALIVASDRSAKRLETITTTSALHKLTSIKSVVLDAAQPLPFANRTFDRILLDAPCSGTGTLRRNPEIRYRISEHDIHTLAAQQKLFLANATRVLKPGGQLVYSTCSVERDENEDVIAAFLQSHAASHAQFQAINTVRTWPQYQGTDGFFIASLRLATQQ